MRIEKKHLTEIKFKTTAYEPSLYVSLKRIGLTFPIKIKECASGYECVDGHKRLSAIQAILKDDPNFPKFQEINVIVTNYARSDAPWSIHNHH